MSAGPTAVAGLVDRTIEDPGETPLPRAVVLGTLSASVLPLVLHALGVAPGDIVLSRHPSIFALLDTGAMVLAFGAVVLLVKLERVAPDPFGPVLATALGWWLGFDLSLSATHHGLVDGPETLTHTLERLHVVELLGGTAILALGSALVRAGREVTTPRVEVLALGAALAAAVPSVLLRSQIDSASWLSSPFAALVPFALAVVAAATVQRRAVAEHPGTLAFTLWLALVPHASAALVSTLATDELALHALPLVFHGVALAAVTTRDLRSYLGMRDMAERLDEIIAATPAGIVQVDGTGTITLVNDALVDMFACEPEDLVGQPLEVLIAESTRARHVGLRDGYLARPAARRMAPNRVVTARRKDGTLFPVEVALASFESLDGRRVIATITDNTARANAEAETRRHLRLLEKSEDALRAVNAELLARNDELSRFAYSASHDLRSPLVAIQRLSAWLEEDLEDQLDANGEEARRHLQLLQQRARRMQDMLDGLHHYARADAKALPPEAIPVDELFAELREEVDRPPGMTIEVVTDLAAITAVRVPLKQVLRNLISNAIKHHPRAEHGHIWVRLGERDGTLSLRVEDDGAGIPADRRQTIFEPFTTLRRRDEVEGSGMGLAIARRHVERAGGTIGVQDREGGGAMFFIEWPTEASAGAT